MERNYIIAGFGGQGVLFAGKTLANAFMIADKNVTWYPCYGAEMRGGTVNCEIVVSDDEVSAVHKQEVDCVLALNQLSLNKFEKKVKSGGTMIYNSSLAKVDNKRDDIKYISAPISEIALKLGSPKFTNMVALGVLGSAEPNLKIDLYEKALKLVLTGKKESMIEVNLNAIKEAEKSILAGNFT